MLCMTITSGAVSHAIVHPIRLEIRQIIKDSNLCFFPGLLLSKIIVFNVHMPFHRQLFLTFAITLTTLHIHFGEKKISNWWMRGFERWVQLVTISQFCKLYFSKSVTCISHIWSKYYWEVCQSWGKFDLSDSENLSDSESEVWMGLVGLKGGSILLQDGMRKHKAGGAHPCTTYMHIWDTPQQEEIHHTVCDTQEYQANHTKPYNTTQYTCIYETHHSKTCTTQQYRRDTPHQTIQHHKTYHADNDTLLHDTDHTTQWSY